MMKCKMFIPMRLNYVLAIDPGFDRVGLAVMTLEKNTPQLLYSQCLKTNAKKERSERSSGKKTY
jgi:hypothetical protein